MLGSAAEQAAAAALDARASRQRRLKLAGQHLDRGAQIGAIAAKAGRGEIERLFGTHLTEATASGAGAGADAARGIRDAALSSVAAARWTCAMDVCGGRVIGCRNRTETNGGLMALQQVKKVGVLGAGLMGHGIAQVAAQSSL